MSIRLRELIRLVRATKTAAEEREVIAKESAALREAFREQEPTHRHRNVAKLMYIHMMGYPTHYGQMETLKLIAGCGFAEKRIGYLGLMILLDERQEVLMLVTNSVKLDLNHKNQYIVGLALAALGNICSAEMARDLAPDVEKLLDSQNSYVRKKAALCAIRIVKKVPDCLEQFVEHAAELLHDRNHAVLLGGVSLMLTVVELDATVVDKYRQHVPSLCKLLKSLLNSGSSPDHEVGGITNPFLQVKILRLLRLLGKGSAEASDTMSDILAQVASGIEGSRNAGNAILYEAVNTIMAVESISGLRLMAVNILGKFLANRDNNIRYVALNTLSKVVAVDTQAVQRHRTTIVECVKDADVSIRRRALELVYSLVNEANIKPLTKELLDYLAVSDAEFKPDLTAKIATLIQRALNTLDIATGSPPDKRWHIDSLVAVMLQAGQFVKEEVARALLVIITNANELHGYAVRTLYRALLMNLDSAETSLVITAVWVIGEFGEMLLPGQGGALLDAEPALTVQESDIVTLVERVLRLKPAEICKEFALTCLMKLTARLPSQLGRLKLLLDRQGKSPLLEVQTRSCEYKAMFKYDALRPQLLERMPALDESEYAAITGHSTAALTDGAAARHASSTHAAAANGSVAAAAAATAGPMDLLGMDLLGDAGGLASAMVAPSLSALDALDALLNVAPTNSAAPAAASAHSTAAVAGMIDMMDLLGSGPGAVGGGGSRPTQAAAVDPLASLLGSSAPPPPKPMSAQAASAASSSSSATPTPTPVPFPSITAWQQHGCRVALSFAKPAGNPAITDITATYTNSGEGLVTDFNLQAAVPKFMQLKLEPASSTTLAPNGPPVVQKLYVHNTQHGAKSLVMRLRIAFTLAGKPMVETTEVSNFPPGL
ncbi:MAG: hypothetical protein WDW38_003533 [Sanguina aurantia]